MKQNIKRALGLLLAVCMLAGLTACGNKETAADPKAKNYVFKAEDLMLDVEDDLSNISCISKAGERLYMIFTRDTDTGNSTAMLSVAMDGSDARVIDLGMENTYNYSDYTDETAEAVPLPVPRAEEAEASEEDGSAQESETVEADGDGAEEAAGEEPALAEPDIAEKYPAASSASSWISVMNMTSDGTQLYLLIDESYNDYSDEQNPIYEETYSILAIDTEGNELWRQQMSKTDNNTTSYTYINSIVGTDEGILCSIQTDGETHYVLLGSDGSQKGDFTLEGVDYGNLIQGKDNTIFVSSWGELDGSYQQLIQPLDIKTRTLSDPLTIPGMNSYSLNVCNYAFGGSYDLYLYDSIAVYGYNIGDTDKTKLLNFVDSDIDNGNMNYLIILDEKTMLMTTYDWSANNGMGGVIFSRMTKVDPADVKDKITLQLACYGSLYEVRSKVIDFNKKNDQYRIQVTDYSNYATDGDWEAGITKLNNDIVSGNVPDILYLNSMLPISSYISKGLFADLYPFIEEDPDMNREDFLQNVLDAFSVDGKLYQLVPNFYISTVVGKSKFVGDTAGWTIDDMMALNESLPEGTVLFSEMDRRSILSSCIAMSGDQFVNWKTGECHFDSEDFSRLLEFCKIFPEEIDYNDYDDNYWVNYETMYREDRTILSYLYLTEFRQYHVSRYVTFGDDITMIGFPSPDGDGAAIQSSFSLAMSAKSKNQDGVWAFMRQYLLDDYQDQISNGFPLSLKKLNSMAQEAQQKPYYLDENGQKVEYDDTYWIADQEIVLPLMTQDEVDTVMNLVKSVDQVMTYDDDLLNIVTEEADAFFTGQKSAAEVASIIQGRAKIYVSENR